MEYARIVKRYLSGTDVKSVKDRLVELGYLHASTHSRFGNDSYRAVKAFQAANNLDIDGKVGVLTWTALFADAELDNVVAPVEAVAVPEHIGAAAALAIGRELATVSEVRKNICLEALRHAIDPYAGEKYPRSFYIRGGNLYNKSTLAENVMTKDKLASYFRKTNYEPYYSDGRKEMMLAAAEYRGYMQTGADCSGGIVGLWLHEGVVKVGFDASANVLYGSYCVQTKSPKPADLAWKSGHIGLYVGGGYVVEWVGGAYGCQLTKANRKVFNFVDGKLHTMGKWSAYGDPKIY